MWAEKIEQLKSLTDWLLEVANRLMNIFLVEGVSAEHQQLVKIGVVFLFMLFILGLVFMGYKIISQVIEPLIKSLSQTPERVFYLILASLLLFFTSDVSFQGGCIALFIFLAIEIGYRWYKDSQATQKNDR